MLRSRTLRVLSIGALVAVLTVGATAAVAQEDGDPVAPDETGTIADRPGPRAALHLAGEAIGVVEDVTGLERQEILRGLGDGDTLAELAEAEGVTTDELVDAMIAEITERIDQAVADGKLTREQADRILEAAPDRVERLVTTEHPGRKIAKRIHHRAFRMLATVSEVLDLERGEIVSTLRSGGTIADIAEDQGMSVAELVDALVAEITERVDQAVADGKLTTDQRARILEAAPDRIERLVTTPLPGRGDGPRSDLDT